MKNSGTALISDMIGTNLASSAFVYGAYELFDKITSGILLFALVSSISNDREALRIVMSTCAPVCSFLVLILTLIGQRYYGDSLAKITGTDYDQESMKRFVKWIYYFA